MPQSLKVYIELQEWVFWRNTWHTLSCTVLSIPASHSHGATAACSLSGTHSLLPSAEEQGIWTGNHRPYILIYKYTQIPWPEHNHTVEVKSPQRTNKQSQIEMFQRGNWSRRRRTAPPITSSSQNQLTNHSRAVMSLCRPRLHQKAFFMHVPENETPPQQFGGTVL